MAKAERIVVVFNSITEHDAWRAACVSGGMSQADLDAFRKSTDCSGDTGGKCVVTGRTSRWPAIALTKARDAVTAGDAVISEGADWVNWKSNSGWVNKPHIGQ